MTKSDCMWAQKSAENSVLICAQIVEKETKSMSDRDDDEGEVPDFVYYFIISVTCTSFCKGVWYLIPPLRLS